MRVPTGVIPLSSAPSSVICFANATFPPAGEGRGPATERPLSHGLRRDSSPKGGAKGRAATWGRPYENFDPLLSVGADVPIGPRRGHLHQGKALRAHTVRPYMAAGRAPPHPALRATFPPGGEGKGPPKAAAPTGDCRG